MRLITLTVFLFLLIGGLTSCGEEQDPCVQETITDPNYFTTSRVLSNTCVKGDGVDYYLAGNQTYTISAALVIEPGTKIMVGDSATLIVEATGSIYAIGRVDAPVEFTNANALPGAWGGILIRSAAANNTFKHVSVDYAGSMALDSTLPQSAITLADGSGMDFSYTQIRYSAGMGIVLESNAATLRGLDYCTLLNNNGLIRLPALQAHQILSTNTFTNNSNSFIDVRIGGTITSDVTWETLTVAYRMFAADSNSTGVQVIGGNGRLVVGEGNRVEFNDETGFLIVDNARFFAAGTATNPLLFTGVRKAPGVWRGFDIRSTRSSNIEYARVEHAGSSGSAVYMWNDPTVEVREVEFTYCPTCAFVDAPKGPFDPANRNLITIGVAYTNVNAQYCKQQ